MSFSLDKKSGPPVDLQIGPIVEEQETDQNEVSERRHKPRVRFETRKEVIGSYMTILAAAFGLISDGYQNNMMTMINVTFKKLYPKVYTSNVSTRVSNSLLVGEVLGQLFIGLFVDRIGRKSGLVVTTALIVIGATLATAAHGAHGGAVGLFWFLTVARGVTGVGTGGEYPASSTSASEAANERTVKQRGPIFLIVTNGVLSLGTPLAVSVFLIALSAAGEHHLETVWRVCFGVGIVLPLAVFAFRMRMLSPRLFRENAIKHNVPYKLAFKRYWKSLIGTSGSWFLYDFVYFPNTIFSGTIIASIIKDGNIKKTAEWQLLLSAIALPGVYVGILLCNPLGRRNTIILGFAGYIVFGLIIGGAYDKLTGILPLFIFFYAMMHAMGSLGPGNLTGLVSAEAYPTPIRGTFYGLSAAIGKAGAAVGTQAFTPIQDHLGKRWTFIVAGICGLLGIVVTYFFVPDMTGIDLADEDEAFLKYLAANGWDGHVGEDDESIVSGESMSVVEKGATDEM